MKKTKKLIRRKTESEIRKALYVLSEKFLEKRTLLGKLTKDTDEFQNLKKECVDLSTYIVMLLEKQEELENEGNNSMLSYIEDNLMGRFFDYNTPSKRRRKYLQIRSTKNSNKLPQYIEDWVKRIDNIMEHRFVDCVEASELFKDPKEREGFTLALNFIREKRHTLDNHSYDLILGLFKESLSLSMKEEDRDIISWLLNMSLTYYRGKRANSVDDREYISDGLKCLRKYWDDLRVWKSMFFDLMSSKFMKSEYMCSVFANIGTEKNNSDVKENDVFEEEEGDKKKDHDDDENSRIRKKWSLLSESEKDEANREFIRYLDICLPFCVNMMLRFNVHEKLIFKFISEICKYHSLDEEKARKYFRVVAYIRRNDWVRRKNRKLEESKKNSKIIEENEKDIEMKNLEKSNLEEEGEEEDDVLF